MRGGIGMHKWRLSIAGRNKMAGAQVEGAQRGGRTTARSAASQRSGADVPGRGRATRLARVAVERARRKLAARATYHTCSRRELPLQVRRRDWTAAVRHARGAWQRAVISHALCAALVRALSRARIQCAHRARAPTAAFAPRVPFFAFERCRLGACQSHPCQVQLPRTAPMLPPVPPPFVDRIRIRRLI